MKNKQAIIICFLILVLVNVISFSHIDISDGFNPDAKGNYTPLDSDIGYTESINSFDDIRGSNSEEPKYYLITQDQSKEKLTKLEYKGKTYNITQVFVGNILTDMILEDENKSILSTDEEARDANGNRVSVLKNKTFFIDDGTYTEKTHTNYTSFTKTNYSFVGLNKDVNGEPTAIFTKPSYPSNYSVVQARDCIERYNIHNQDMYFENIIFDGGGKDLLPLGGKHWWFGNSGIGKNRGEYLFYITGDSEGGNSTDGFVMRDCIIQNVGLDTEQKSTNLTLIRKNIAINFYETIGQHNIEDLIIRNVKVKKGVFGMISINQADKVNLKNINFVPDNMYDENTYAVKVENQRTNYLNREEQKTVLAGDINLALEGNYSSIYIQDSRYKNVIVPETFNYSSWNITQGSRLFPVSLVTKQYPGIKIETSIHDLKDDYYIVDANHETISIEEQLKNINKTIIMADGRSPKANIKIATSSDIPSFTIPNFNNLDINIVAVRKQGEVIPIISDTTNELVSFIEEGVIDIDEKNTGNIKFYNFDFHEKSKYTLHQAVKGIEKEKSVTNEYIPRGVRYYSLENSEKIDSNRLLTKDNFVNCRFTVILQEFNLTATSSACDTLSLEVKSKDGYTDLSIADDLSEKIDSAIKYEYAIVSGDAGTIDKETGEIKILKDGEITISVKANDNLNQGEIVLQPKEITLNLKSCVSLIFDANSGKNPPDNIVTNKGTSVEEPLKKPTREGYRFKGWSTLKDGTQKYIFGVLNADTTVYAMWEKVVDKVTLSFDANSGKNPPDNIITNKGTSVEEPLKKPTREGYRFKGWSTLKDGTQKYIFGVLNADTTVYAMWEKTPELPKTGTENKIIVILGIITIITGLILLKKIKKA